jgi:hypothetical protein
VPVRLTGSQIDSMALVRTVASANVSIAATTSATGTVCITLGPFTVENAGLYRVKVYTPSLVKGTTNVDLELWQGTPGTGTMLTTLSGHLVANAVPFVSDVFVTLSAGSNTLKVAGFVDAATGTFSANVGTTGNFPNAYAAVYPA